MCIGRATALKAGGRGFESQPSSLFFYKNGKKGSGLLPCLPLKSKFTCMTSDPGGDSRSCWDNM